MNLSIRKKLVIIIYTTIFVMFLILTSVLLFVLNRYFVNQLSLSNLGMVKQVNSTIGNFQNNIENLAMYFSINPDVQQIINYCNKNHSKIIMQHVSIRLVVTHSFTSSVVFYRLDGEYIDFLSTDTSVNPVNQTTLPGNRPFKNLINGAKVYQWEYIDGKSTIFMEKNLFPKLCLWRCIKSFDDMRPIGAVAITANTDSLLEVAFPDNLDYENDTLLMTDSRGNQIIGKGDISLSKPQIAGLLSRSSADEGIFAATLSGKKRQVAYKKIGGTDWVTFYLSPTSVIPWSSYSFIIYIIIAVVMFLLLLLPILMFISNFLTKPLKHLADSMMRFTSGDFDTQVRFDHNDEIGVLGSVFNSMVTRIKELIQRTYLLQIKEREAELTALQAQINPHFLYNLIDSIQWNALRKGEKEIAEIANSLGQFFRISLSRGKNHIPVQKEMELVEHYLKLQKMRFKKRIEYSFDVDRDTLNYELPKLIIQPLVENSVLHGAEDSKTTVTIKVSSHIRGGKIIISVEDNGVGMSQELLEKFPDNMERDGQSSHFALRNISDRLKSIYDKDHSFTCISKRGGGTIVEIQLPLHGGG